MLAYFVIFSMLGFFIGKNLSQDKAVFLIVGIAIFWGLFSAPVWGLACLGELLIGLYIAKM